MNKTKLTVSKFEYNKYEYGLNNAVLHAFLLQIHITISCSAIFFIHFVPRMLHVSGELHVMLCYVMLCYVMLCYVIWFNCVSF